MRTKNLVPDCQLHRAAKRMVDDHERAAKHLATDNELFYIGYCSGLESAMLVLGVDFDVINSLRTEREEAVKSRLMKGGE